MLKNYNLDTHPLEGVIDDLDLRVHEVESAPTLDIASITDEITAIKERLETVEGKLLAVGQAALDPQ